MTVLHNYLARIEATIYSRQDITVRDLRIEPVSAIAAYIPELPTFPHHKHVGDRVEPCQEPDLHDVLREIDARLYS